MPDLVTRRAFCEQVGTARGTSIRLFQNVMVARDHDLVGCPTRPGQETPRADPYGVLTNRAEKPFVRLSVLLHKPLFFWEGNGADEVDQEPRHHNQESANQDVFEVLAGEVFVNHEGDLDQRCRAEGEKQREVDAGSFLDDHACGNSKNGQQDRKLEKGEFQTVFLAEPVKFLSGRLTLPFNFLFDQLLLPHERLFAFKRVRYCLAQLLVFFLVVQKEFQAAREVRLFGFRKSNALLHTEFLEFDELVDGSLQTLGTVTHDPLFRSLVFNLSGKTGNLLLKFVLPCQKCFVEVFLLNRRIVGATNGSDVIYKEAKNPEYQHCQNKGKQPYGKTVNPGSL